MTMTVFGFDRVFKNLDKIMDTSILNFFFFAVHYIKRETIRKIVY